MLGLGATATLAVATGPNNPAVAAVVLTPAFSPPAQMPKKALTAALIATTAVGFVAPPQVQPIVFSRFSQPLITRAAPPDEQPSTLFEVAPPAVTLSVFSRFSQPLISRVALPDEQPSTLFEVQPPQPPPFTGFAKFEGLVRVRANISLLAPFSFVPFIPPPDTHDGVWVKRKRKRIGPDPIDLELAEKASRRAALELAIYGLEVEYSEPPKAFEAPASAPVDVAELAKVIASAQAAQRQAMRAQSDQDDETDLESILREII